MQVTISEIYKERVGIDISRTAVDATGAAPRQ
jgi:hypothetical protein